MWTTDHVKSVVTGNRIVLFAKGSKEQPMCGFSHRAIHVMTLVGEPFEVVNIFEDETIRPALVEATGWPTTPQVFVGGEMIGGSDIVMEMYENGELAKKVDSVFAG